MPDSFPMLPLDRQWKWPDKTDMKDSSVDPLAWQTYRDEGAGVVQILVKEKKGTSKGTGFVADDQGRVITDWHVVQDGLGITVRSRDGRTHNARLLDFDPVSDLAVLQLYDGKNFVKPLTLTNSDGLKEGSPLVSLSHPRGVQQLYASSGTFRHHGLMRGAYEEIGGTQELERQLAKFNALPAEERDLRLAALQSPVLDAHIHTEEGSSGGPLFDETGRIVGVSRSGEVKNSSHAIFSPSEKIRELLNRKQPEYLVDYDYTSAGRNFLNDRPGYSALIGIAGLGTIGGTCFALGRYPKRALTVLGVAGIGELGRDAQIYSDTFDSRELEKYGFASGADATFASGALLNLAVHATKLNPRIKWAGGLLMSAGAVGRVGAEFIPTHPEFKGIRKASDPARLLDPSKL